MMVFVKIETIANVPSCAFFNTVTDRFEENAWGTHDFESIADILTHSQSERLLALVPESFLPPT